MPALFEATLYSETVHTLQHLFAGWLREADLRATRRERLELAP